MLMSFSLYCCLAIAQADNPASLYFVENVYNEEGLGTLRNLTRLSLGKDNKLVKEILMTENQRFFGHFGGHRLVDNRYVATCFGGVIDIPTRKILLAEQDGELLGSEDGKVVFRVRNAALGDRIFAFDLKTHKLDQLKTPGHWGLPGVKAPDRKRSVESIAGVIRLCNLDGSRKELASDYGIDYSPLASPFSPSESRMPLLWLDNSRILTQQANGKLIVLNINGTKEKLVDIADAPKVISPPRLWLDPQQRIIYSCERDVYWIDVKNKRATKLESYAFGNGFEGSVKADAKGLYTVLRDGKAIGRWHFNPHEVVTAPGLIAFAYVEAGGSLGYPKGIAVWQAKTGDWQTIDAPVNSLIGWAR